MRKRIFRIIMSLAILLLVILSGMLAYSYFNVERAVSRSPVLSKKRLKSR